MWNAVPGAWRLLILAGVGFGLIKAKQHFSKKKLFISFAIEDKKFRNLLVGQSKHPDTPFEFADMSVKQPWSRAWKTQCRERIKGCDGFVVIVSDNTYDADGVHWEVKCAEQENIPIMAMYIKNGKKTPKLPIEFNKFKIETWSWKNIETFVSGL